MKLKNSRDTNEAGDRADHKAGEASTPTRKLQETTSKINERTQVASGGQKIFQAGRKSLLAGLTARSGRCTRRERGEARDGTSNQTAVKPKWLLGAQWAKHSLAGNKTQEQQQH
jgi:hypothetical protein